MAKRRKARLVQELRCKHIVDYTTYPEPGKKSHRVGRCSRWTFFDCGYCRKHDELHCNSHRIFWKDVKKNRRRRG